MTISPEFNLSANAVTNQLYINEAAAVVDTVGLASNIKFVLFDGKSGVGKIIYNDRAPLPDLFDDPTSLQFLVQKWITAQSKLAVPLTLAQAKAAAIGYLTAMYNYKRQQPVTATIGAGTLTWDASDQAVAAMGVNGMATASISAIITALNTDSTTVAGIGAQIATAVNTLQASVNAAIATAVSNGVGAGGDAVSLDFSIGSPKFPVSGIGAPSTPGGSAVTAPAAVTLKLFAIGDTTARTLTTTEMATVMAAITTQAITEKGVYLTKQAAINALTTIAGVVAFDSTTGW